MLEKTLESPLDYKEIQPVHSEGDQPWDFFGRNDAKAETPLLWPHDGNGGGNGNPCQYLAWKIPWTEEPGGLQSMGSRRVGLDLETEGHGLQRIF